MIGLTIPGIGAFTSVGGDAPTTMGSILSGVQLIDDLGVTDAEGEPIGGAATPLGTSLAGAERLANLGLPALLEAAGDGGVATPTPVVLCAPNASDLADDPKRLIDLLVADAALPLDSRSSVVIAKGRDGIGEALRAAHDLLRTGRWRECFLLGVDSLVGRKRLRRLVSEGRVLTPSTPDGVIPGEGAAALRLGLSSRANGATAIVAFDDANGESASAVATAEHLVTSIDRCLSQARVRAVDIAAILPDAVAPQTRLEELALSGARRPLGSAEHGATFFPGLATGEVGAAAGVLALATLAFFIERAVVAGPGMCLLFGEKTWRGAAIVAPS